MSRRLIIWRGNNSLVIFYLFSRWRCCYSRRWFHWPSIGNTTSLNVGLFDVMRVRSWRDLVSAARWSRHRTYNILLTRSWVDRMHEGSCWEGTGSAYIQRGCEKTWYGYFPILALNVMQFIQASNNAEWILFRFKKKWWDNLRNQMTHTWSMSWGGSNLWFIWDT